MAIRHKKSFLWLAVAASACSSPSLSTLQNYTLQTSFERDEPLRVCQKDTRPEHSEINTYLEFLMQNIAKANPETFQNHYAIENFCIGLSLKDNISADADPIDGSIQISRGILKSAPNDAAIAAVIAHELAHITKDHRHRAHPALEANADWRQAHEEYADLGAVLFDSEKPEVEERFAAADRRLTEIQSKLISAEDFANWREVEADDVGLILFLKAKMDASEFSWVFSALMSDAQRVECDAKIEKSKFSEIKRGVGPHPEPCWRRSHFVKKIQRTNSEIQSYLPNAKRREINPGVLSDIKSRL